MDDPLVWVDLEMTGLSPEADVILEIAVVVTDGKLDEVVDGPDLVLHATSRQLTAMEPVVIEMHRESGLTEAARRSSTSVADAERQVLDFVRQYVPEPGTAPLAGNSVHIDRTFLRKHMPTLEAWLHYRNVDVSTLKELIARWDPELADQTPDKTGGHRAAADIHESIAELRFYRDRLF